MKSHTEERRKLRSMIERQQKVWGMQCKAATTTRLKAPIKIVGNSFKSQLVTYVMEHIVAQTH